MDKSFLIEPTDCTPRVVLNADSKSLLIEGESFPENVRDFYEPVVAKVEEYLRSSDSLEVQFDLRYFNTSSSKTILDLLEMLESHFDEGKSVRVVWLYKEGIEVMQENGEDFADDLRIPFELKSY
tara:strand:+ start:35766 stop:36140 length:375 start_codon:yes stop_codon:yes gene_type:complete